MKITQPARITLMIIWLPADSGRSSGSSSRVPGRRLTPTSLLGGAACPQTPTILAVMTGRGVEAWQLLIRAGERGKAKTEVKS